MDHASFDLNCALIVNDLTVVHRNPRGPSIFPIAAANDHFSANRSIDLDRSAAEAQAEEDRASVRNPNGVIGGDDDPERHVRIRSSIAPTVWTNFDIAGIWSVENNADVLAVITCFHSHHSIRSVLVDVEFRMPVSYPVALDIDSAEANVSPISCVC